MKCLWTLVVAVVMATLVVGCSKKTPDDLVGTYVAEWSFGRESLDLRADRTYEQSFSPTDETLEAVTNSCKWEFDRERLTLHDPVVVQDPYVTASVQPTQRIQTGAATVLAVRRC